MAKRVNDDGNPEGQRQRQHRATYARNKKKGGYLIRVEGPHAAQFAGRIVPVTKKDGSESEEEIAELLWTGTDDTTAKPVALYTFVAKPKDDMDDEIPF
jgi:hypothetical protein